MLYHDISILIPTYNVEQYIRECLDSVINQSYTNIEIIVVDEAIFDNIALDEEKR